MTTSHELKVKPSWNFMFDHPAHVIAFGFGSGLARKAPGTWGTLVAFPMYYYYVAPNFSELGFLMLIVLLFGIGVWACEKTGKMLGQADYGGIVWDEIVAFLLVLFFTPAGMAWNILAFALFRFFDILKPPPIRHFDRTWHGGLGVMFDDILAAGYTLLCLAVIKTLV